LNYTRLLLPQETRNKHVLRASVLARTPVPDHFMQACKNPDSLSLVKPSGCIVVSCLLLARLASV